jgi:hypothetical protein
VAPNAGRSAPVAACGKGDVAIKRRRTPPGPKGHLSWPSEENGRVSPNPPNPPGASSLIALRAEATHSSARSQGTGEALVATLTSGLPASITEARPIDPHDDMVNRPCGAAFL